MSESSRPQLRDIAVVLSHLGDRARDDAGPGVDPIIASSLRRALEELERFIPGLEPPPDPAAAGFMVDSARGALRRGRNRDALARALRGLSFAPHHPDLHYLAGLACLELGAIDPAIALLLHTLWIHPGHPEARADLEALDAFAHGAWGAAPPTDFLDERGDEDGTRFELLDDPGDDERRDEDRAA